MEHYSREAESLRRSGEHVDEMQEIGNAVLRSFAEQRDRLKNAQRRVFDITSLLGVSNSVLKLIERRHSGDKALVYGGMVVVTILIALMYWWFVLARGGEASAAAGDSGGTTPS